VLVSGLAPIRALKLRHYEDANFVTRLRSPPRLSENEYSDRPVARPNDWGGKVHPVDLRLATLPYRELMQVGAEEGGLKQQLPLFDEAASPADNVRLIEEHLLEDEADTAADRNQMQRAASASGAVRRAHAVTRDDDDLLPAF
jgi:type IV secretion system protein VirD4